MMMMMMMGVNRNDVNHGDDFIITAADAMMMKIVILKMKVRMMMI